MDFLKPDTWPKLVMVIASRYFLLAGMFWLLWYVLFRKKAAPKKIQPRFPKGADYRRELFFSALSMLIFATVTAALLLTPFRHYTFYYGHVSDYPMWWFWTAFPLTFLVHDTYFYWTHRMMHHPRIFRWMHLVHHKSTNPSPWAAFSFHPAEAVVEAGVMAVLVLVMPLHAIHVAVFFALQMLYNVYGHLGWELYPAWFRKSRIGRWVNTSSAHNAHHQYFRGNYGLYFLWWDRWCGTLREEVKRRDLDQQRINRKHPSGRQSHAPQPA